MLQRIVFSFVLALSAGTAVAATTPAPAQEHMIGVRVAVDAAGKVTSAQPSDVDLRADGTVDPDSIKAETMELKVKSSFAEARYLDAISASLRESQFVLEKVAGTAVPERLTLPYKFGGGGGRRGNKDAGEADASKKHNATDKVVADKPTPEMKSQSLVAGVTLPKVRFTAPAAAPAKP